MLLDEPSVSPEFVLDSKRAIQVQFLPSSTGWCESTLCNTTIEAKRALCLCRLEHRTEIESALSRCLGHSVTHRHTISPYSR